MFQFAGIRPDGEGIVPEGHGHQYRTELKGAGDRRSGTRVEQLDSARAIELLHIVLHHFHGRSRRRSLPPGALPSTVAGIAACFRRRRKRRRHACDDDEATHSE